MSEQRIVIKPGVMGGKPIVRGTRVTVERVLTLLAQGLSVEDLLKEYPHLTREDVSACLAYAASLAGNEEFIPLHDNARVDRKKERKRGMARVVRHGKDDGSFDAEFWSRFSPEERLEMIWDMTLEAMAMKGIDEHQLRLQRSVARVERR